MDPHKLWLGFQDLVQWMNMILKSPSIRMSFFWIRMVGLWENSGLFSVGYRSGSRITPSARPHLGQAELGWSGMGPRLAARTTVVESSRLFWKKGSLPTWIKDALDLPGRLPRLLLQGRQEQGKSVIWDPIGVKKRMLPQEGGRDNEVSGSLWLLPCDVLVRLL
jgi:hypothetical protein